MKQLLLLVPIFIVFVGIALPTTINVPADFPTIQLAIDASAAGDTVLVHDGTYNEDINFLGKAILVKAKWGPETTVIWGTGTDSVVTFNSGEGPDSILAGFTITGGTGKLITGVRYGGGIHINQSVTGAPSSPTIRYNKIIENKSNAGGGIYVNYRSKPYLLSNVILLNNSVTGAAGGGSGGGLYFYLECEPILVNNILYGNFGEWSGGGIYAYECNTVLTSNTIAWNSTNGIGGGFQNVFNSMMGNSIITNTIFWNNDGQTGNEIFNGGVMDISYTDITGTTPPDVVNAGTINWLAGVITSNPNFVSPSQADLHLFYNSLCRDAGTSTAPYLYKLDFEGDPRIVIQGVDIGADEFHRHLYYTGNSVPGGSIELKIVDFPGTTPVALFLSGMVLDPPIGTIWGNWWLGWPWTGPILLGAIPGSGVMVLPGTLPAIPGPYNIYFQSLQGGPLKLTNLCIMHVD